PRGLGPALALPVVLVLAALPAARGASATVRDAVTLWRHALAVTPRHALVRYNLGRLLVDRGELITVDEDRPGALDLLSWSLARGPHPGYAAWAHQMLGDAANGIVGAGPADPERAARHYRLALHERPGLVD